MNQVTPEITQNLDLSEQEEIRAFMAEATGVVAPGNDVLMDALKGRGPNKGATTLNVVPLIPFEDWDYYIVSADGMEWLPNQGQDYQPVVIPKGFASDLTSVPRLFWSVLPREGKYAYAAVVHDYLYWVQTRPRDEADMIFKLALRDANVNPILANLLYTSVSIGGFAAWERNAKSRKAGECRLFNQLPEKLPVKWSTWKKQPGICAEAETS